MELAAVEIARRHLEAMWNEPGSAFKQFDSAQITPPKGKPPTPKPPKPFKQSETRSEEWEFDEGIRDVLSMGPSMAGKAKVAKTGPSSSSSSSSSSGAGSSSAGSSGTGSVVQDAAARERDLAESSALYKANKKDVLDQLREGSVPFGTFVNTVRSWPHPTLSAKRKVDKLTQDCLSAVSPDVLPSSLGRKDQFTKRKHLPDPRPVAIVAGQNGVDEELAVKMRRAQAYSMRDDRPHIIWACVDAFRNASSR